MISTYHTIFLITFFVSVVLLLFLMLYIPMFHVFQAIGWLTGLSKRKEMQSYDENGMSTMTKTMNKKTKQSKDKPGVSFKASAPVASLGVLEESSGKGKSSKPEKSSKKARKSSRRKKSITEQFVEPETERFNESSGTDLFVEDSVEDVTNNRGTDIFAEASADTGKTLEVVPGETDIFAQEAHETSIFDETAEDTPAYRGTDILPDKDEIPAYRGTDILSEDKEDDDEIFISVGSEIPDDNNLSRGTELLEDGEV